MVIETSKPLDYLLRLNKLIFCIIKPEVTLTPGLWLKKNRMRKIHVPRTQIFQRCSGPVQILQGHIISFGYIF